ncbi:MBL fold hydrolase, partial [Thermus scotoductus]
TSGVEGGLAQLYALADPPYMNLQGLVRYWQKHHPEALG